MEYIFIRVFNMGIAAGWLILAVMLLRIILRNMPKAMRCILWGIVGIRLLWPSVPASALSLIPSAQTVGEDIAYQQSPAINSGIAALNQAINPGFSHAFAPKVSASANPLQILIFFVSIIWVVGMALMAVYAMGSYWKLHQKVRESVEWEENLYFCDRIGTPFILGVLRPRIYLPSSIGEKQAGYVYAHEQAHLARRDHIWKLLGFALLSVYWFHPLCWVAYWLFCRDLELACDERVVRDYDVCSRKEYSRALLECSHNCSRIAAYPLAFGEINVKARIQNVLNYEKPAFWKIVAAAVVCIIAAVCFLTNPREGMRSGSEIFARSYMVQEIAYYAPIYSNLSPPEASSHYYLTKEHELIKKEKVSEEYQILGILREEAMSAGDFDRAITANIMGTDEMRESFTALRDEIDRIWYAGSPEETGKSFYYIFQQNNGDLYLCYGYDFVLESQEEGRIIGWIFKLKENVDYQEGLGSQGKADVL